MSFDSDFNACREEARRAFAAGGDCRDIGTALVLLGAGAQLEPVNRFLSGKVVELKPRNLDVWSYYAVLHPAHAGLSPEARAHVESICDRHYNAKLPAYVSLDRSFDPWDYQLCGCPTENHLFNDSSNRLAETVVFPDRVFSDGHTAAEYRPYWEDAFRRFVAARVRHGFREWRSSIYCHVLFDDAMMIYYLMPPGPTKEAARVMLDAMFLNMAVSLRGNMWTGPHSRVYNNLDSNWCSVCHFHQCYGGYASVFHLKHIPAGILAGDYVMPEAIARLPFRQDRYISIEKVGPRFYPRGEGQGRFNPGRDNVYICQSDREDWGGDGLVYNYMTPRYGLGSVQDWGKYDGEWHMHCLPWTLMMKCDDNRDMVLSFTGSQAEANHQGGCMTWANADNDQDATIFQHRKTLFCQIRGWRHDKFFELLWDGYPEAPWAEASGRKRLMGHCGEKKLFKSRFYVSDSIPGTVLEGGWLFGEKNGVCFAIRPVRGAFREEPQQPPIEGRIYLCDIWDDVILLESGETEEFVSYKAFRERVLAAPLAFDSRQIRFTNLEGDAVTFCWKEDGNPTVNGVVPEYGGMRFRDPCINSELDSGVIRIECEGAVTVLDVKNPDAIRRVEG